MEEKTAVPPQSGHQIEEAIALFEGILHSSPDDHVALEALSLAYEQTGNSPLARTTLIRLAQAIIRKNAYQAAPAIITRLKPLSNDDFDALEALRSLEALVQRGGDTTDDDLAPSAPARPIRTVLSGVALRRKVLRREIELAWKLHEASELTPEEYATLVEDLSRLVSNERHETISLLHALVDRAHAGIDRILQYLAKTSKIPFLALENFAIQPIDLGGCSLEYLLRQGALPFAQMGDELLIALLNPLDKTLPSDIAAHVGRKCRFYLIRAEAFDAGAKELLTQEASATSV